MKSALLVAACVAACLTGAAAAQDSVGDLRVLVIRATWGPTVDNEPTLADAASFYDRASFGQLRLHIDITPWLHAYEAAICPSDGEAAKSAARTAGYDVSSYARVVYVLPEEACDFRGVMRGNEILLTAAQSLVHELGHTFGLDHATANQDEYGDPLSPMGHGTVDFSAFEKLKLGWITSVQRADRSRTYVVADIDAPSTAPQALVVPTNRGEYWFERRGADPQHVIVRLVPASRTRTFYVAATNRFAVPKVFSVTSTFAFKWLDRARPSPPRAHGLDNSYISWRPSFDAGSGIAQYRVTLDGKLIATTTELGVALPSLQHGGHRVTVVAVDRAGNRSRPGVVSLNV
ncbi:MAG: hypothetical protein ACJ74C_15170 [Gaiellaceae bacterium]